MNRKIPLTLITAPMTLSFLSGMFDWYIEDGMYMLFGLAMIIGLGWLWIIELKKNNDTK
jgi:hypothetical protein